jgi:hypothetical protein
MASRHRLRRRKTEGGLDEGLANLRRRQRITESTHAGRGGESKWEIPAKVGSGPGSDSGYPGEA